MEALSEDKDTAAGSEDDLVDRVYLYLKDNAYPKQSSVSLKRQIRLRSKKLKLRALQTKAEREVSCLVV